MPTCFRPLARLTSLAFALALLAPPSASARQGLPEDTSLTGNETCTSMAIGDGRVYATGYAALSTSSSIDYVTWAYSLSLVQDATGQRPVRRLMGVGSIRPK